MWTVPVADMEALELVDGESSLSEGGSELPGTSDSESSFDCAVCCALSSSNL